MKRTENKYIIYWVLMCLLVLSIPGCSSDSRKIKVEVTFLDNTKDTLIIFDNYTMSSNDELYHWVGGGSSRMVATNVKYVKELENEKLQKENR